MLNSIKLHAWRFAPLAGIALALALLAAGTMAAGTMMNRSASNISLRDLDPEDPQVQLAQAKASVTFQVLEPQWLPADYSLAHVMWIAPSTISGATASSVDSWYEDLTGSIVHIWQTDIPESELQGNDDPVASGERTLIDGEPWFLIRDTPSPDGQKLTVLSQRLSDGRTVSLDGAIDADSLERIAGSLSD